MSDAIFSEGDVVMTNLGTGRITKVRDFYIGSMGEFVRRTNYQIALAESGAEILRFGTEITLQSDESVIKHDPT